MNFYDTVWQLPQELRPYARMLDSTKRDTDHTIKTVEYTMFVESCKVDISNVK
jgi:hypothetical protein